MDKATYHSHRSASASLIKTAYNQGAAGVWQAFTSRKKKTKAMDYGTACHTSFLEPHLFDSTIACCPHDLSMATKHGIAWKNSHASKTIIKLKETQTNPPELSDRAQSYLAANYPPLADRSRWIVETPIFAADVLGHPARCMPDILIDSSAFTPFAWTVISYKTARDISHEALTRVCVSGMTAGYDIGEALYRRVIAAVKGCEPEDVAILWLVSCTSYPGTVVAQPTDAMLGRADAMLPRMLDVVAEGLSYANRDTIPAAATFHPPMMIDVPRWADSAGSAVTTEEDEDE